MVQPFQSPQHRGGVAHTATRPSHLAISSTFQSPQHRGGVAHGSDILGWDAFLCFNPLSTGAESRTHGDRRFCRTCMKVSIPSAPGRSRARRTLSTSARITCGFNPLSTGAESRTARDLLEPAMDEAVFQSPQHRGGVAHSLRCYRPPARWPVFQSPQHRGGVAHAELAEWDRRHPGQGFNPLSTGAESRTQKRTCLRTPDGYVSIPSAPGRSRARRDEVDGEMYCFSWFQSPQHRGGVAHA